LAKKRNRVCIYYALSLYIFRATSTKNSVSLLEAFTEPPYFSETAEMEARPMLVPPCLVEQYPPLPFLTFPSKLLVETIYSMFS